MCIQMEIRSKTNALSELQPCVLPGTSDCCLNKHVVDNYTQQYKTMMMMMAFFIRCLSEMLYAVRNRVSNGGMINEGRNGQALD
jgi:hypothetical protein